MFMNFAKFNLIFYMFLIIVQTLTKMSNQGYDTMYFVKKRNKYYR